MPGFFDYVLAGRPNQGDDNHKKRGKDDEDEGEDNEREGPVRTQMVGESPGDDIGYDPDQIPTEPIPDED